MNQKEMPQQDDPRFNPEYIKKQPKEVGKAEKKTIEKGPLPGEEPAP